MEEATDIYFETIQDVKFSEVDSLKIVWHGHYIRYFEDAREAFGKKYGIGYLDIDAQGYSIPIVQLSCNYKAPLQYGDVIVIRCTYIKTPAAKIIFHYTIKKEGSDFIVAEGKTIQVFVDKQGIMQLYTPEYFEKWKLKMKLG